MTDEQSTPDEELTENELSDVVGGLGAGEVPILGEAGLGEAGLGEAGMVGEAI